MHPKLRFFRRHPKRVIATLIVLLLAFWLLLHGEDESAAQYEYVAVTRGDIEEVVTAQGKLEPKEFVDVGAQVSGQLTALHVEIGDTVEQGQLIAEIDPKIYTARVEADEARLKTLRAQLAEQEAQVAYARSVFERNERLIKLDAISKEGLEASQKEYRAALARVASIGAQIEEAESTLRGNRANLSYTKIYAPIGGTVVSQTAKEGQTLNANQMAPVIVQIADLSTMTVRAQVAEADVSRIHPGMDVYFTTLGSDRRWNGAVRQVLPSPDPAVLDVILYNALVDVQNEDGMLMTGMSAQMFFVIGSVEDVPLVPVRALGKELPSDEPGETHEIRMQDGTLRPVRVGLMNRNQAQVLDGLETGDTVAVPAGTQPAEQERRRVPRL